MVGKLIPVTTGGDIGDWIAITSGNVEPGLTVITRGTENMMPFPVPVIVVDDRGVPIDHIEVGSLDRTTGSSSHGQTSADEGR